MTSAIPSSSMTAWATWRASRVIVIARLPSLSDLAWVAGDEVPPHDYGLVERGAADDHRPRGLVGAHRDLVAADTEVGEMAATDDCVIQVQRAREHDQRTRCLLSPARSPYRNW
jgi:hypothetical protein